MIVDTLEKIDYGLTKGIFTLPHNTFTDLIFLFFSFAGNFGIIWMGMFFVIFYRQVRHDPGFAIPFLGAITLGAIITNLCLKLFFQRPRPLLGSPTTDVLTFFNSLSTHPILKYFCGGYPTDYAFPSGHSTLAFAAATAIAKQDPRHAVLSYGIAGLIAFSRIYLGFHYVSDVVAGSLIGWLSALIVWRLVS
jgi:undecaprenyl-diphosphatase